MKTTHVLRIRLPEGVSGDLVGDILGAAGGEKNGSWEFEIVQNEDYIDFVDVFINILDGKIDDLLKVGIKTSDVGIWEYNEFVDQCNLEYKSSQLRRLGEAGLGLCISCWQG